LPSGVRESGYLEENREVADMVLEARGSSLGL
jgi:hypothetical protein